jgi:hypothetical protein
LHQNFANATVANNLSIAALPFEQRKQLIASLEGIRVFISKNNNVNIINNFIKVM